MNDQLTEAVIGAAHKVYNTLGFGFLESVYEKALAIELRKLASDFQLQHPIKVYYDDETVGDFFADVFLSDRLIIELKSVQNLKSEHEVQLVNYLTATRIDIRLLITSIEITPDMVCSTSSRCRRKFNGGRVSPIRKTRIY